MILTAIAGFTLLILAAVSSSLSMNFQKLAQSQTLYYDPRTCLQKRPIALTTNVCSRPMFLIALILSASASVLDFVALAFLPTSVVGIFATLSIVINLMVTRIVLFESPKMSELLPISFVFIGCSIALVSSSENFSEQTPPQLLDRWKSALFIVFNWMFFIFSSIFLDYSQSLPLWLEQVGFPLIAGGLGAQNVCMGKYIAFAVTEMIEKGKLTVRGDCLVAAVCLCIASIVVHIVWLNKGLKKFAAYYCIIVYQSTWCLFTIICGIVVYDNNDSLSMSKWAFFLLGIGTAIFGVITLARVHAETKDNIIH